jgi:hypothetical protein
MTAISVMMVVFFTSLRLGHETRFISARTSRRNCDSRPTSPTRGPVNPRSRRAPRPSCPSPKRAARGDGSDASGFSISSISLTFFDTQRPSPDVLAGVPGFEPGLSVLETDVLTVDTIPLCRLPISNCRFPEPLPFIVTILNDCFSIGIWQSAMANHQAHLVSLWPVCLRQRRQNF